MPKRLVFKFWLSGAFCFFIIHTFYFEQVNMTLGLWTFSFFFSFLFFLKKTNASFLGRRGIAIIVSIWSRPQDFVRKWKSWFWHFSWSHDAKDKIWWSSDGTFFLKLECLVKSNEHLPCPWLKKVFFLKKNSYFEGSEGLTRV